MMRAVVPWAPIRFVKTLIVTGPRLANYEFDQAFGTLSLAHVAVEN
jgi:hypothetical protein